VEPYKEELIVKTHFVDIHKEFHLYSLVNILQDLAARNADELGFGWDYINPRGWFWALLRLHIKITRHPRWKERIIMQTWPKNHEGVVAYRDFLFTDLSGNPLIAASSAWIVLDRQTRRPVRMSQVFTQHREFVDKHAIETPPPKIVPPHEKHPLKTLKVLFTDLDMNLHMNNANYVRKILDAYPLDFLKQHHVTEVVLNYLKETFFDDEITVFLHNQLSDREHFLSIENGNSQSALFARFVWEKVSAGE